MDLSKVIGKDNLPAPSFFKKIYIIVSQIPKGFVASYQDVAKACGNPNASRAVGTAMAKNRDSGHVPCHRVVKSNGSVGFYQGGPHGSQKKKEILEKEGIEFEPYSLKIKSFSKVRFIDFKKDLITEI